MLLPSVQAGKKESGDHAVSDSDAAVLLVPEGGGCDDDGGPSQFKVFVAACNALHCGALVVIKAAWQASDRVRRRGARRERRAARAATAASVAVLLATMREQVAARLRVCPTRARKLALFLPPAPDACATLAYPFEESAYAHVLLVSIAAVGAACTAALAVVAGVAPTVPRRRRANRRHPRVRSSSAQPHPPPLRECYNPNASGRLRFSGTAADLGSEHLFLRRSTPEVLFTALAPDCMSVVFSFLPFGEGLAACAAACREGHRLLGRYLAGLGLVQVGTGQGLLWLGQGRFDGARDVRIVLTDKTAALGLAHISRYLTSGTQAHPHSLVVKPQGYVDVYACCHDILLPSLRRAVLFCPVVAQSFFRKHPHLQAVLFGRFTEPLDKLLQRGYITDENITNLKVVLYTFNSPVSPGQPWVHTAPSRGLRGLFGGRKHFLDNVPPDRFVHIRLSVLGVFESADHLPASPFVETIVCRQHAAADILKVVCQLCPNIVRLLVVVPLVPQQGAAELLPELFGSEDEGARGEDSDSADDDCGSSQSSDGGPLLEIAFCTPDDLFKTACGYAGVEQHELRFVE
eukprot:Rhum_TRINITY_DN12225_c0_g1::Rhum_TRINITY_DN12225_c0_g1_i1::g.50221::m.50221